MAFGCPVASVAAIFERFGASLYKLLQESEPTFRTSTRRVHKTSDSLSKNHAVVVVEGLPVKNLSQSARKNVKAKSRLNRAILDASPFELRRQLEYKMRWRGGLLVAIPPGNTSRCCPECRHVAAEKPQDASKIRLCGMRIPNASRLGSSLEHQRGGTRLVSLHASFGCSKPVVSGTHRRHRCLACEPVGIPSL